MGSTRVCSQPGCPNLRPCAAHAPKPWAGHTRRARIGKTGWQIQSDAKRIIRRDKGICYICGRAGADEADHIIPVAEGGADVDANKAAVHAHPCHADKSAAERARGRRRQSGVG